VKLTRCELAGNRADSFLEAGALSSLPADSTHRHQAGDQDERQTAERHHAAGTRRDERLSAM